jgi:hypothetical protein
VSAQAAQQVDHTAAWLAFFGVLAVAIIAAATAQWRQWAEHKHDRSMRDLDDLRIVLDHGYDAADRALRSLAGAREATRRHIDSTSRRCCPRSRRRTWRRGRLSNTSASSNSYGSR